MADPQSKLSNNDILALFKSSPYKIKNDINKVNIIIKTKMSANTANSVASHAVNSVLDSFRNEVLSKEAVKVLPQYMHKRINYEIGNNLLVESIPRPKKRVEDYFHEEGMKIEPHI